MNFKHKNHWKIAAIGEAMVELSETANNENQLTLGFAGDTLNSAIYMKRLLDYYAVSCELSFVSAVGQDKFSDRIKSLCESEALDTTLLTQHASNLPGIYAINIDDFGERSFSYWRENSAARHFFNAEFIQTLDALKDFDVLYYSGITLAIMSDTTKKYWFEWLSEINSNNEKVVAFDSNFRPALWASVEEARAWITEAYSHCNFALASVDDEANLFGDSNETAVRKRLQSYNITNTVLKRGENGPITLPDETSVNLDSTINVVDTTAAGDSFNGAYLASLIGGQQPERALQFAHDIATSVIGFKGAIIPKTNWLAQLANK